MVMALASVLSVVLSLVADTCNRTPNRTVYFIYGAAEPAHVPLEIFTDRSISFRTWNKAKTGLKLPGLQEVVGVVTVRRHARSRGSPRRYLDSNRLEDHNNTYLFKLSCYEIVTDEILKLAISWRWIVLLQHICVDYCIFDIKKWF